MLCADFTKNSLSSEEYCDDLLTIFSQVNQVVLYYLYIYIVLVSAIRNLVRICKILSKRAKIPLNQ